MARACKCVIATGLPKSGKSFFNQWLVSTKNYSRNRMLVSNPASEESWEKIKNSKKVYSPLNLSINRGEPVNLIRSSKDLEINTSEYIIQLCKAINKYCVPEKKLTFSGLCIFDDASAILPSDISGKAKTMLRNLVSIRRQLDTDFIFNFHSLNNVPPFISDVASDLVIFRGNIKLRGNKFDEVAQEVQQIVNDISKKEKYNYGYISIDEGFYYIASIENGKEKIKFAKRF